MLVHLMPQNIAGIYVLNQKKHNAFIMRAKEANNLHRLFSNTCCNFWMYRELEMKTANVHFSVY
jgi:hypothetical protein